MERGGVSPDKGPVLVSGATGGVGGVATIILSTVTYSPIATGINQLTLPIVAGLSCGGYGRTEWKGGRVHKVSIFVYSYIKGRFTINLFFHLRTLGAKEIVPREGFQGDPRYPLRYFFEIFLWMFLNFCSGPLARSFMLGQLTLVGGKFWQTSSHWWLFWY